MGCAYLFNYKHFNLLFVLLLGHCLVFTDKFLEMFSSYVYCTHISNYLNSFELFIKLYFTLG